MKNSRFLIYCCCIFFACQLGNKNVPIDLESIKYLRQNYPDSFLLYAKNEIKNSKQEAIDKSNILTQLGHYYYDNSALDSAYEFYQKAYTIREQIGDKEAQANSMASMADVLTEKGLHDSAMILYESLIKVRTNKENINDDYCNLAGLYSNSGNNAFAQKCFQKTIALSTEMKDSFRTSRAYFNYALFCNSLGKQDSALYYLNLAETNKEYSGIKGKKMNFLLAKSMIFLEKNDFYDASKTYKTALNFSFVNNLKKERIYVLEGLCDIANRENNWQEKSKYLTWQLELSDTLFSENILNTIANLQVKYDTERKFNQIILLKAEHKIKNTWLIALAVTLLLLCIVGFLYFQNQKNKRKKTIAENKLNINKLIEEVNQTKMEAWAEGQEKERSRIANELHDRLGGVLAMACHHFNSVEAQFERMKEQNNSAISGLKKLLNNAIIEVRELSKDISSNLVNKLGLSNALGELIDTVQNATELTINFKPHKSDCKIPLIKEIALYRVAQEALNNIMKHAKATTVEVSLVANKESLVLMIEDNGIGFENKDNLINSLGLKSMRNRIENLEGTFTIDTMKNRGTTIIAEIPI